MFFGYQSIYEYHILKYLKQNLKLHGKVIDIGCGYSGRFLTKTSANITEGIGIDINTVNRTIGNLKLVKGSATRLPLKKNTFDYAFLFEVMEHIKEDSKAFKEAVRVLKSRGYLIISTPNKKFWEKLSYIGQILKRMGHERAGYDIKDFQKLAGRNKMKIVYYDYFFKDQISRFFLIYLYTKLPSWIFNLLISPIHRFMVMPIGYLNDRNTNREGADMFIVMRKI